MAKKPEIETDLFAKTDTKEAAPKKDKKDIIKSKSAGLKISEWAVLDRIAEDMGVKPHAIRAHALRYFMKQYQAGKIKLQTETVEIKKLKL